MTPKTFRKIALSFPETHEEPHFVRTSFRVGKKIFATMDPEGPEAMVRVRPPERLRALLEAHPDVFLSYRGWTERNAALGIRLARAHTELIRGLLVDAWRGVVSKRVIAQFDRRRASDPGAD